MRPARIERMLPGLARDAAAESLTCAETVGDRAPIRNSRAFLGWLASLAGDAAEAEQQFTTADQIEVVGDPDRDHLHSLRGTQWAEWLARTGRTGSPYLRAKSRSR